MVNASEDVSKNFSKYRIPNIKDKSTKNKLLENINLETEVKNLKQTLSSFEENNGYISPYHEDIINKKKEKKVPKKITVDISEKVYELYKNKYYLDCYDLWSLYNMKPLLNLSSKENFEMLRHLTKIKDEFLIRKKILSNLDKFNFFDDNNYQFETGIDFNLNKNDINKRNINIKESN